MTGNNDPTLAAAAATKAGDGRPVAAGQGANRDPGPTCDVNAPSMAEEVVALLDGYLADLKAGRQPDRDQLLRDHPHLASQLEACLAGLEFIHRVEGNGDGSVPARLGDFRIHREVGRGGMGAVYEATQLSLGRRVALKVIRFGPVSDQQAISRFEREAETVARLHHTNIVPIYTVGCEGGVNYYAMEFIDGRCLTDVLKQSERPIDPQTIAAWGLQAAEALAHAHQRGVIHRDVKPSNLLLDAEDRIWLTDFGLARRQDDVTLSMTGALLGTPRYMSPEQAGAAHQRIDHRTDIYSLGATLYELAVGRPPFTAETHHAVISQILSAEPTAPRTLRPDLPRDLETIIVKCLAKEAPQRYSTAAELADDLRAYHEGRAIRARRASLPERVVRWVRQQRRSVGLSAAAAAATLLIAITTVASMYGYRQWQTAYLPLATNHPPLVAEVVSADADGPLATQTVPTQNPIELPAGEYRLRVTGDGRMSQELQVRLPRQTRMEQSIDLEDQLLWPALALPSVPSNLDFRVEGFEFTSGVADFHLPIDAALRVVDIVRPCGDFGLQRRKDAESTPGNALSGQ